VEFDAPAGPGRSWRKFCSPACTYQAASERATSSYPPREEVVRLYVEEGLTDLQLGRHFGRSNMWAFKLRHHYGIPARPKRKVNSKGKPNHLNWSLKLKGEFVCRSCGCEAVHLHHIVPRSKTTQGRLEVETNGMPLCFACHRGWHDGRVIIFRDRLRPQELAWAIRFAGPLWVELKYPYRPDILLRRQVAVSRGQDPDRVEDGASEDESMELARLFNSDWPGPCG
jgi:hypothetical protein